MYTLLKPLYVQKSLLERNMRVFAPVEFALIFNLSTEQSKYYIKKFLEEGLFTKLKRNLYALKTVDISEEEIANILYKPSYISFEYALSYYNMLPEMVYSITSATTKATRTFSVGSKSFIYYSIQKDAYAGYTLVLKQNNKFLMADPEKAFVDYIYFVVLGKKSFNERITTKSLKKDKVLFYAKLYKRRRLIKAIKKIL